MLIKWSQALEKDLSNSFKGVTTVSALNSDKEGQKTRKEQTLDKC